MIAPTTYPCQKASSALDLITSCTKGDIIIAVLSHPLGRNLERLARETLLALNDDFLLAVLGVVFGAYGWRRQLGTTLSAVLVLFAVDSVFDDHLWFVVGL